MPADIRAHVESLVGQTIPTITGRPNTVLRTEDEAVIVATTRSPDGQPVPWEDIEAAYQRLLDEGEIEISPESVGYRSAFVGAVLGSLPNTAPGSGPRQITLHGGQVSRRNPPWNYEELILALDLYRRRGMLDDGDPEVVGLSRVLNELPQHAIRGTTDTFRNPNGVAMKLANFARLDPDYEGAGLSRGARRDEEVWTRFEGRDDELARLAAEIRAGVVTAGTLPSVSEAESPEVAEARAEADALAKPSRGPPRRADAAERRAIEVRAMEVAREHYQASGWQVSDVSASESFDLRCTKGDIDLHVEVKGTTSDRPQVVLTKNEVAHARTHAPVALVWVSGIELRPGEDRVASGGTARVIDPWNLEDGIVEALSFAYTLPGP